MKDDVEENYTVKKEELGMTCDQRRCTVEECVEGKNVEKENERQTKNENAR